MHAFYCHCLVLVTCSYYNKTFLQETADLTAKQQWYQQNQVSMLKDDEEGYVAYCSEAMFKIHILELRLQVRIQPAIVSPQAYL